MPLQAAQVLNQVTLNIIDANSSKGFKLTSVFHTFSDGLNTETMSNGIYGFDNRLICLVLLKILDEMRINFNHIQWQSSKIAKL